LFIEGSVLFSPMIYRSIKNYLALSCRKRTLSVTEFDRKLTALLEEDRSGPLVDADLEGLFEEKEDFSRTVGNFGTLKANWLRAWQSSKSDLSEEEDHAVIEEDHTIEDLLISRDEIRSALNYLLYVQKYQKPPII